MSFRLLAVLGTFALLPGSVWAGGNPDFDQDAIPILDRQSHLVEFVHNHYDVKGMGEAKVPGNENHAPEPPYIFEARPLHSDGPFYLRLLIQPGPPGRILKVVDIRKVHFHETASPRPNPATPPLAGTASRPAAAPSNPPSPAGSTGASPAEPTSETPSGPIKDSTSDASGPAPKDSGKPALTPPPDPAPATP